MARKVTRKEYMKTLKKGASANISQTQWKEKVAGKEGKAGRLYGPKGKLYTGRVQMSDGSIAVYKEGKRIGYRGKGLTSPARKPDANGRGGSGAGNGSQTRKVPTTRVTPSRRGEGAGTSSASSSTPRRTVNRASAAAMAAAGSPGRRRNPDAAMPYQAAGAKTRLQKQREEASARKESRGTVQGFLGSVTAKPKKGATKESVNSKMTWDGKRWVRTHIKKKGPSGKSYWVKL